jgi:hypothetical protein
MAMSTLPFREQWMRGVWKQASLASKSNKMACKSYSGRLKKGYLARAPWRDGQ